MFENKPTVFEARATYLKPRLFVDLTTSVHLLGGAPVGITRVETKLAAALLEAEHLNPFPVIMAGDGSLRALDMATARMILKLWQEQVDVPLRLRRINRGKNVTLPSKKVESKIGEFNHRFTYRQRMKRMNYAARVLLRQPGKILSGRTTWAELTDSYMINLRRSPQATGAQSIDPHDSTRHRILHEAQLVVNPTSKDFLWTAGLYSHCIRPRILLELKSKSSLKIGCLLYDVIRIMFREYNPKHIDGDVHLANTLDLMEAADMMLAISKWTKETSSKLAKMEGRNHQPIDILPLGVDIPVARLKPEEEAALRDAVTQRPFALVVGTVEPRKNVFHLLKVWEELGRSGNPPLDLVIVGREGYGAEDEARFITSHPLFEKHVFWLDSCPDKALTSLYRMSTVVLCPSHAEGWGLSVSEALLQGRPVIASNTSAHPEAGFGQALLLGVKDTDAWADAIRRIAETPDEFLPDISSLSAPTWEQAGQRLVEILETQVAATPIDVDTHAHTAN